MISAAVVMGEPWGLPFQRVLPDDRAVRYKKGIDRAATRVEKHVSPERRPARRLGEGGEGMEWQLLMWFLFSSTCEGGGNPDDCAWVFVLFSGTYARPYLGASRAAPPRDLMSMCGRVYVVAS